MEAFFKSSVKVVKRNVNSRLPAKKKEEPLVGTPSSSGLDGHMRVIQCCNGFIYIYVCIHMFMYIYICIHIYIVHTLCMLAHLYVCMYQR